MRDKIKEGDKLYAYYQGDPWDVYTVERTTKTRAYCDQGITFDVEPFTDDTVRIIPKQKHSMTRYYIESSERQADFARKKLLAKAKEIDFDKLNIEQLSGIIYISQGGE